MTKKASIIIPVYNTRYDQLIRCVQSILGQNYQDFEIIIVDDGSPSIHQNEFEKIGQTDSRISIIHQENKGVSAARNIGIEKASGDYIAFVDGDDEINDRFLIESVALAEQYGADLVIGTIQYVDDKAEMIKEDNTEYVFENDEISEFRRSHLGLFPRIIPFSILGSSSARLIHRGLLKNIRFNTALKIYEDQIFNRELLLKAKKAVYLHHVWYYYYQYQNSTYHTDLQSKGKKDAQLNIEYLKNWFELNLQEPDEEIKQSLFKYTLSSFFSAVNHWVLQNNQKKSMREKLAEVKDLYSQLNISSIVEQYDSETIKTTYDKVLFVLVRNKQFMMILWFLETFNIIKRIRNKA